MTFLLGFLVGYWTCLLLGRALNWWYRRRDASPPTFHNRRKYRDAPIVVEVPPPWEREEVERCVRYEWINIAGERE